MTNKHNTILEIGSGSFKLHQEGAFTRKFQSALGKDMKGEEIAASSLEIAFDSLLNQIMPFLEEQKISPQEVLVFATAAVRSSFGSPLNSLDFTELGPKEIETQYNEANKKNTGPKLIIKLKELGFQKIKVFSTNDECLHAGLAVVEEFKTNKAKLQNYAILDTGGASHQLMEVKDGDLAKQISIPIGSHLSLEEDRKILLAEEVTDELRQNTDSLLPSFVDLGFSRQETIVCIGTTGTIISNIPDLDMFQLKSLIGNITIRSIEERRAMLESLITDEEVRKLFVDFRLQIMPNSLTIIYNAVKNLGATNIISSSNQAMNFVSKNGFN